MRLLEMTERKDDGAHGHPRTTSIQGPPVTKLGEAPQWGQPASQPSVKRDDHGDSS